MSSDKKEITKAAQTLNELNFLENDGNSLGPFRKFLTVRILIGRPIMSLFETLKKMELISSKKIEFT